MKEAPKPTRTRPPQMKTIMFGTKARTTSPRAHKAAPMRKFFFQPMMVPIMPPAVMKAPAMREYTMLASWMSATVTASDRAPLSPEVPIWTRIKTRIGRTRNFSLPPSLTAAVDAVAIGVGLVDVLAQVHLGERNDAPGQNEAEKGVGAVTDMREAAR